MRLKIGIFGRVNVGKSTLLNGLMQQSVAIVSKQKGTTTDPVRKGYEWLGIGPVIFIDTAGIDDKTTLGEQRLAKTKAVLQEVDMAVFLSMEKELDEVEKAFVGGINVPVLKIVRGEKLESIRKRIVEIIKEEKLQDKVPFYGEQLKTGQIVLLVCPIDSQAPSGRLILPQVQALRAALDLNAMAIVVQTEELEKAIQISKPNLVVTDSQIFDKVKKIVPKDIPLTSFSILLAQRFADMELYTEGLKAVDLLKNGSKVLLVEYCSHGVSCEDIGRVKIPFLLEKRLGFQVNISMVSGREPLPSDLNNYSLVVQCGGCMMGEGGRIIKNRIQECRNSATPITNYGLLLRYLL